MRALWLTISLLLLASLCPAQTRAVAGVPPASFDFERNHLQIVSLDGLWRFQPGDDPSWASADFDDSSWKLLRSDVDWGEQGYLGLKGLAWYRFQVAVPPDAPALALMLPGIRTNYEVYANGKLIGGLGEMPPHPEGIFNHPMVFDVPASTYRGRNSITIALRIWQQASWSSYQGGGPLGHSYLGDAPSLRVRLRTSRDAYYYTAMQGFFLTILTGMGAVVSIALFLLRRKEREYLWFGCMLLFWTLSDMWSIHRSLYTTTIRGYYRYDDLLDLLILTTAAAFYYRLLQGRRSWLLSIALGGLALSAISSLLYALPQGRDYISVPGFATISALLVLPIILWILILLVQRARQRQVDALLLLAPVFLLYGERIVTSVIVETFQFGLQHRITRATFPVFEQPFRIDSQQLVSFFFLVAMLAILVNRFARTRQKEERFASELEAARAVQQVLIPDMAEKVPGFTIESVYIPAGQVGGDFFQVIPVEAGGAVIVIGDVSGKGTPAAMTVSLLVGTVRTLAHYTRNPGEILSAMNQRMLSRSGGGFTTCLVLRADPDGRVTIASAGHLSPYKDGSEIPVEASLPLGLAAQSEYPETVFQLGPGERLALVTDGVVEARSKTGELFGFERTTAISSRSAESIARTAQDFGQDDDITVLTIARDSVAPLTL